MATDNQAQIGARSSSSTPALTLLAGKESSSTPTIHEPRSLRQHPQQHHRHRSRGSTPTSPTSSGSPTGGFQPGTGGELMRSLSPRQRIAVAAAVLAPGGDVLRVPRTPDTATSTAHFTRAVSIYKGTEVRVPRCQRSAGSPPSCPRATGAGGHAVRREVQVPADAKAVIVTPTLTADRFVQLTPAYTSGANDGRRRRHRRCRTPARRSSSTGSTPSLADLTKALGPNGANKNGTLNHAARPPARRR